MVSRIILVALAAPWLACGSNITIDNSAEPADATALEPAPDPCEVHDRASCCEAGCERAVDPRTDPPGDICVSAERLCYVKGNCGDEPLEADCPLGYSCIKATDTCRSSCDPSGEWEATGRGYCLWTGD